METCSATLIDALAGAIGEADMGRYFPSDSDPAAQGARSVDYVRDMTSHVAEAGLVVEHVDSFVTLGTIRLGPHLEAMRAQLADALDVEPTQVSVKARSNNGLGPEGLGEAASATVPAQWLFRRDAEHPDAVRPQAPPHGEPRSAGTPDDRTPIART